MSNLKAHTKGSDVLLAFDDDIADALIIASQSKKDSDIMHLAKTAQIVRKELLEKKQAFDGSFPPKALTESVPDSLLALMNMIVEGPNIKYQTGEERRGNSVALIISQLLLFNCKRNSCLDSTKVFYISLFCKELIKCGCKKACRDLCKYSKANFPCTELCYCAGIFHRD